MFSCRKTFGIILLLENKLYISLGKRFIQVFFIRCYVMLWASMVAQILKNLPAMQETRVQSLGQEDSLEEEMATHSSVLAWTIP